MKTDIKPIENYAEFGLYNGRMIEIVGEIYNEPIFNNPEVMAYNKIRVIDVETKAQIGSTFWGDEPSSLPDLKEVVKNVKADPKRTITTPI